MAVLNSTQRFSSRVDNYIRYRPGYPPGVLETLQHDCNLRTDSVIADVGSGTGLLSKIFLENGNRVIGVEPNHEMRQAGGRILQNFANFGSVEGTAEATTLPDASVDFITAGQAAHWFDRVQARREFLRILKPGGWTVFVWNDRSTDSTPLLREYERLLLTYGTDYHEVKRVGIDVASDISAFFAPSPVLQATFHNHQDFDFEGLKGRLLSSSYTPGPDHANYEPMLAELRRLFDAHNQGGRLRLEYETHMYYGQLS
jgi:SAM-dependent methyltransferase